MSMRVCSHDLLQRVERREIKSKSTSQFVSRMARKFGSRKQNVVRLMHIKMKIKPAYRSRCLAKDAENVRWQTRLVHKSTT